MNYEVQNKVDKTIISFNNTKVSVKKFANNPKYQAELKKYGLTLPDFKGF